MHNQEGRTFTAANGACFDGASGGLRVASLPGIVGTSNQLTQISFTVEITAGAQGFLFSRSNGTTGNLYFGVEFSVGNTLTVYYSSGGSRSSAISSALATPLDDGATHDVLMLLSRATGSGTTVYILVDGIPSFVKVLGDLDDCWHKSSGCVTYLAQRLESAGSQTTETLAGCFDTVTVETLFDIMDNVMVSRDDGQTGRRCFNGATGDLLTITRVPRLGTSFDVQMEININVGGSGILISRENPDGVPLFVLFVDLSRSTPIVALFYRTSGQLDIVYWIAPPGFVAGQDITVVMSVTNSNVALSFGGQTPLTRDLSGPIDECSYDASLCPLYVGGSPGNPDGLTGCVESASLKPSQFELLDYNVHGVCFDDSTGGLLVENVPALGPVFSVRITAMFGASTSEQVIMARSGGGSDLSLVYDSTNAELKLKYISVDSTPNMLEVVWDNFVTGVGSTLEDDRAHTIEVVVVRNQVELAINGNVQGTKDLGAVLEDCSGSSSACSTTLGSDSSGSNVMNGCILDTKFYGPSGPASIELGTGA